MENVVHKIYHLTFPNGGDYVGSTCQKLNERYGGYRNDSKKSKSPICEVSTQYKFNEVNMVEVDRIKCPMYDSKIKILEEKWKKKLNPTLNINKAHRTKEENKEMIGLWNKVNKELVSKRQRKYDLSPIGKLNSVIYDARQMVKHHTKKNNLNMVSKWEGILEERIQQRSQYRLASQSS
jgi:hypothetical protein